VTRLTVGHIGDFPERAVKVVTVGKSEIGIVHWQGQFFALRNICPHEGAGLCHGTVRPHISAAGVGQLQADESAPVVTCPWHGWEFDARTGRSLFGDPTCRVRTYPVRTEGGHVIVEV
jgi:nitrite reductase (NADH) small subunit